MHRYDIRGKDRKEIPSGLESSCGRQSGTSWLIDKAISVISSLHKPPEGWGRDN
jgi:hypothetical protein